MASFQKPPQEELEYQFRGERPLFQGTKALPADIISKWLNDHVYDPNTQSLRVTMDSPFGDDVVYTENEYADPLTRLGILVGGVDADTDEFKSLKFDDEGRLMVDAAISIQNVELEVEIDVLDGDQIGVWGYEDGNTSFPVPLNLTSEGYLQTTVVGSSDMSIIFDDGVFSGGVEHSLVSFTVGAGQEFYIDKVSGEGRVDGLFRLKINNSTIEQRRNNWSQRNVDFLYAKGLPLNAGDIVELTVEHNQLTSFPFSGTIYGENQ